MQATPTLKSRPLSARGARLVASTLVLALAGTFATASMASPHGGGHHEDRHGMMMGGAGPMQGRMLERMLDSVNATDAQRAQIKQIVEASRAEAKARGDQSRDQHRALREQSMRVFTQPNIDANAAEALRQQMLAQHDAASKRRLQTMLDIARVLTPEQRQQLAQRMAQRMEMRQRHQQERSSLEGGAVRPQR